MKSKKRSGASFKQKPPESPTLFLDRSFGKKTVAEALRGAGANVEVHDDHFPQDATDETWLTEVGKKDWIVLTKDRRIRFRRFRCHASTTHEVMRLQRPGYLLELQHMRQDFLG